MRSARLSLILTFLTVLAVALVSSLPVAAQPTQPPASPPNASFVPDEVLVQFRAGVADSQKAAARATVGAARREIVAPARVTGRGELELASLPPGLSVANAIRALENHPAVAFAEPNWIYTHTATSDDPYYTNGSLWGMYGDGTSPTNQYGSQAGEAWAADKTGSNQVYVGVIDEGIQYTHPDLNGQVWTNPFDPVDGIDNDGNGYVDDVNGWDMHGGNNTIYDGKNDDHGTHVAGTIGAKRNGAGVVGVNWNVTLISCKFLGPAGGSTANAIKCVDYLTDLKTRHGLNIVATSNSWGGGGFSEGLLDAINRGGNAGILFIAAAGNGYDDNDAGDHYPSNYQCTSNNKTWDCVIAVAAIASNGSKPDWSNYGATTVDLGAPGSGIYSTVPENGYKSYSGTSMATPHVSGAAALYASANSGATAEQIKSAILSSTIATDSLSGKTVTGGRLDVSALMGSSGGGGGGGTDTTAPTVTIKSVSGSGGTDGSSPFEVVTNTDPSIVWNANEGGNYAIKIGGSGCDGTATASGTYTSGDVTSTISIGSLTEGANTVRVCLTDASNNTGSASASITKDTAAPTISNLQATNITSSGATITWTTNENATSQVEYRKSTDSNYGSPVGSSTLVTSHSVSLSGLTADTTYYYRVKSTDAAGNQTTSSESTFKTLASSTSTDMYVGDLSGTSTNQGSTWTATVTITVVDANGSPVYGASVSGSWSQGATGSANCNTNSSGQCSVSLSNIRKNISSVTYSIDNITEADHTYTASANVESTITVTKP